MSTLLLLGRMKGAASGGGALSLTLSGVSQSLSYSEPLGRYPSGAARTLFVQFTRSLTNGSPVSGTLTVPGRSIAVAAHRFGAGTASTLVSFSVPLQDGDIPSSEIANCTTGTRTDDSATWSNNNAATWYTGGAGIPAGVLWPTSAAHLCAANDERLVPQGDRTPFTGSAAALTAFTDTITSTVLAWDGTQWSGAQYERLMGLFRLACTTADVTYLRIAIAFASRMRRIFWANNLGGIAEQWQAYQSWTWLALFRRDTVLLGNNDATGLMFVASALYNVSSWFHDNNPRYAAHYAKAVAGVIKAGRGGEQNQYGSGTYYEMADALIAQALVTGGNKLTQTNGRLTIPFYAIDGTTVVRSVYAYMAALYITSFVDLLDVMPASANKTALLAQLATSAVWVRDNMAGTSSGGTASYLYQDVDIWYASVPATLAANYTAGSTSITITIAAGAAPPDGWPVSTAFSAGSVIRIGGVSKKIVSPTTWYTNGSGTSETLTLEAGGFASSYSNGQAVTFMRDAAVGVNYDTVDLNGFVAAMLAWHAEYASDSTSANAARVLVASLAETPRDGANGPYLSEQKQWDECMHQLEGTLSTIDRAGV